MQEYFAIWQLLKSREQGAHDEYESCLKYTCQEKKLQLIFTFVSAGPVVQVRLCVSPLHTERAQPSPDQRVHNQTGRLKRIHSFLFFNNL